MSYQQRPVGVTTPAARRPAHLAAQRWAKVALFCAMFTGIWAIIAALFVADPKTNSPVAQLALVVLVVVCGLLAVVARAAMSRVRYRVALRSSAIWLVVAAVAGYLLLYAVLMAVGPLESDSLRATGTVLALPVMAGIWIPLNMCTLFAMTDKAITMRWHTVRWSAVAAVVYTRDERSDVVEIGLSLHPGTVLTTGPMPIRADEVLTDLPYRVRIRGSAFSPDRLRRAVDQFGPVQFGPGAGLSVVERIGGGEVVRHRTSSI
ncbi:hypothetical protein ABLE92_10760 [Gordonia sp. VNQ95]|uniref:hypothetical protein n=1 Tax=Gordonia sp. VNQ95 TaxID=3156619 RepID=UPI0032B5A884